MAETLAERESNKDRAKTRRRMDAVRLALLATLGIPIAWSAINPAGAQGLFDFIGNNIGKDLLGWNRLTDIFVTSQPAQRIHDQLVLPTGEPTIGAVVGAAGLGMAAYEHTIAKYRGSVIDSLAEKK